MLAVLLSATAGAAAATVEVAAEPGGLAAAIAAAAPGDRLVLAAGRHAGPIVVDRALTLEGEPGAVLDGGGAGRVVTIDAPQVVRARADGHRLRPRPRRRGQRHLRRPPAPPAP